MTLAYLNSGSTPARASIKKIKMVDKRYKKKENPNTSEAEQKKNQITFVDPS